MYMHFQSDIYAFEASHHPGWFDTKNVYHNLLFLCILCFWCFLEMPVTGASEKTVN